MAELDRIKSQESKKNKKLSGKQIFMSKKNIVDDSETLVMGEEEPVEVDESLFEDLEDFDLDDCELSDSWPSKLLACYALHLHTL